MKLLRLTIIVTIAVLVLVFSAMYWHILHQPIPRKILSQAGFGVWYPDGGPLKMKVTSDSIKLAHQGSDKLVTFEALGPANGLSFTEQAIPESFTDVPDLYQKLTEKLHSYADIDTINGTVSLTRPEELKGAQTAIMKARGTLVFIRPQMDLSKDDWVKTINALSFAH